MTSTTTFNFLEQLPPRIRAIAERVKLTTPEAILNAPKTKFLDAYKDDAKQTLDAVVPCCTPEDVRILKQAAAKLVAPKRLPFALLLEPPYSTKLSRITFGCTALDHCTRGGILNRGITEICGASAAGKTQLLLQLSLCVQLPIELGGLGKGAAYICTEDAFPSKRLLQISKAFAKRYPMHDINYMGNIYIEHQYEAADLLTCILERLPKLLQTFGIGLIIIDSVAAIFRLYTDFNARARDMRKMANALLNYAEKYECAIICVNQITSPCNNVSNIPCLGLAWAHLGRTRLSIAKVPKQLKLDDQLLIVRKLEIIYSPETPNESAEFLITSDGIIDVPSV